MATGFNDCSSLTGWTEQAIGAGTQFTDGGSTIVSSGNSTIEILSLDAIDSDAERQDIEILFKYQTNTWNSTHYIGIARGSDSDSASTSAGYIVALRSTAIRTYYKNSGGSVTQIASTTISTLSVDTDYWVRLRVNHSGTDTVIQAAVSTTPPSTWDCDTTTSLGPGIVDGYAGLYSPNNSTHTWSAFGYGTNGDTAPSTASSGSTGTLTSTLDNFTFSFSGTTTVLGTLSTTLGDTVASLVGSPTVNGTFTSSLENAPTYFEGSLGSAVEGDIDVSLVDSITSFTGSSGTDPVGTFASTLEDTQASLTGTSIVKGTLDTVLDSVMAVLEGTTTVVGNLLASLANVITNFTGYPGEAPSPKGSILSRLWIGIKNRI